MIRIDIDPVKPILGLGRQKACGEHLVAADPRVLKDIGPAQFKGDIDKIEALRRTDVEDLPRKIACLRAELTTGTAFGQVAKQLDPAG
jgi:hypothetical protein